MLRLRRIFRAPRWRPTEGGGAIQHRVRAVD
jgi:hypothetical protein